ncbi:hypothetical protein NUH87_30925 [Pseudomonas batumici]|uniref:hypothetical protein n=1 Tax=Pseudomonas batumici TaxID=226910 RepID=UPI0030CED30A
MPSVNGDSITPLVTNTNATDNFSGDAPNLSPVAQTLRKITNSGCPSGSDLPVSGSADTQAANVFKEAGNIYTDKLIKQGLGKLGPLASSFAERLETTKKVKYLWLRHLAIVVAHQSKFIESQLEVCRKNQSGGNTSMRDLTMAHQILKELVDKVDNEITRVNLTRGDVAKAILKGVRSKVTGANNGSVLENKICLAAERMCSVGGARRPYKKSASQVVVKNQMLSCI